MRPHFGGQGVLLGGNTWGTLGDGSRTASNRPVAVAGGLLLPANRCWAQVSRGDNYARQLGDGSSLDRAAMVGVVRP